MNVLQNRCKFCYICILSINKSMKPIKKPMHSCSSNLYSRNNNVADSGRIKIKLVSDKERDTYRIPTYGYILP